MQNLVINEAKLRHIGSDNALAFHTNGKSIEVVAHGQSAKTLTNVLAICLLAVTCESSFKLMLAMF